MADEAGMTVLERLAAEIRQARDLGIGPADRWDEWAQTALAEARAHWLPEREFRHRTGSSDKWCRKHYDDYAANGLARRHGRKREWHIHARLPAKRRRQDFDEIERDIMESFAP